MEDNIKRIYWIDVAKGLLILLMVLGHISIIAGRQEVDTSYLVKCIFYASLYTCFFMQAFLMLTGYTSNFDKDYKVFAISLVKTILVPWIVFSIISQICRVVVLGGNNLFVEIDGQFFFFLFEDFWFLHVLFGSKIVYYVINKYVKSDFWRFLICLSFMIVGFGLFANSDSQGQGYHYNNYFHYKDLLCMFFFLWFGNYCKRHDVYGKISGWLLLTLIVMYLGGHTIRLILRMKGIDNVFITPVILSHSTNIHSVCQIPTFLFYVILGSLSFFGLMQYVHRCSIINFFGKNSLVVYCCHFIVLNAIIIFLKSIIVPDTLFMAIIYTMVVLLICLVIIAGLIKIIDKRPFNYLIGHF